MGIMLAFLPFLVFAMTDRFIGTTEGLVAGTAVSAFLVTRDVLAPGKSIKILEGGTLLLFAALTGYIMFTGQAISVIGARLIVDLGLLAIILFSLVIGRPFTLEYAKENVSPEISQTAKFRKTNIVITSAWALAFLVMVCAELVLLYAPDIPHHFGIIAIVVALVGAVKFTKWYPTQVAGKLRSV
ncbi:hypothetical protein FPY71_15840 [Aureimonas fodinaquatilis]|uniref:Intracellular septation protein n=1 Tax=Aureimonas fodinaquatilis TaxID=2565783 RepID=A0A5B0DSN7_9HYPH|nr:hypothetical protein [Aureimonas fodinaquatilis]KAA0969022.1 hypothetical protein FPY71_15840 [Aureimonas fodinaquatilis]